MVVPLMTPNPAHPARRSAWNENAGPHRHLVVARYIVTGGECDAPVGFQHRFEVVNKNAREQLNLRGTLRLDGSASVLAEREVDESVNIHGSSDQRPQLALLP